MSFKYTWYDFFGIAAPSKSALLVFVNTLIMLFFDHGLMSHLKPA